MQVRYVNLQKMHLEDTVLEIRVNLRFHFFFLISLNELCSEIRTFQYDL